MQTLNLPAAAATCPLIFFVPSVSPKLVVRSTKINVLYDAQHVDAYVKLKFNHLCKHMLASVVFPSGSVFTATPGAVTGGLCSYSCVIWLCRVRPEWFGCDHRYRCTSNCRSFSGSFRFTWCLSRYNLHALLGSFGLRALHGSFGFWSHRADLEYDHWTWTKIATFNWIIQKWSSKQFKNWTFWTC